MLVLLVVFSDEIKKSVDYLKAVYEDDEDGDIKIIMKHWYNSYNYRRATVHHKSYTNVAQVIDKWPIIKQEFGYTCVGRYAQLTAFNFWLDYPKLQISFDFKREYGPVCENALLTNWKYVVQNTDKIRDMICKSNTKTISSLAKLPSKGKKIRMYKL